MKCVCGAKLRVVTNTLGYKNYYCTICHRVYYG